jgi:hypothetical protein
MRLCMCVFDCSRNVGLLSRSVCMCSNVIAWASFVARYSLITTSHIDRHSCASVCVHVCVRDQLCARLTQVLYGLLQRASLIRCVHMCACVCACAYVCVCVRALHVLCLLSRSFSCTHTHMHIHAHTYIYAHIHTQLHLCVQCLLSRSFSCTSVCAHVCSAVHFLVHLCVHMFAQPMEFCVCIFTPVRV